MYCTGSIDLYCIFGGILRYYLISGCSGPQPILRAFSGRGKAGRFSQLERDLGADPQRKLDDFVAAMDAGSRKGTVETALLPGWNVLVYESPDELAKCIGAFLQRWDWDVT